MPVVCCVVGKKLFIKLSERVWKLDGVPRLCQPGYSCPTNAAGESSWVLQVAPPTLPVTPAGRPHTAPFSLFFIKNSGSAINWAKSTKPLRRAERSSALLASLPRAGGARENFELKLADIGRRDTVSDTRAPPRRRQHVGRRRMPMRHEMHLKARKTDFDFGGNVAKGRLPTHCHRPIEATARCST